MEDSWEREKKSRGDIEKLKRQAEGNLKLTQETVADLERNKMELSQARSINLLNELHND